MAVVGLVSSAIANALLAMMSPSWLSEAPRLTLIGMASVQNSSIWPRRATSRAAVPSARNTARSTSRA